MPCGEEVADMKWTGWGTRVVLGRAILFLGQESWEQRLESGSAAVLETVEEQLTARRQSGREGDGGERRGH